MDKKKFNTGLKKIALAMSLAFIGPIIFIISSNPKNEYILQNTLSAIGIMIMLTCIYIGYTGIKKILSAFFDNSNE
tara:strand:- start:9321 stop:9548 length:228 start_codon:yes stop_codon:yes gene_type:complete